MGYSIGEISRISGLSIPTLRYYEKEGLLNDVERRNGIRVYNESHINTLNLIECLKNAGLQIEEIKHYMDLSLK